MSSKVMIARREADLAKAAMLADVAAVRHALTPAVIADRASVRVSAAVETANSEIRARPGAAGAALGLVWLLAARHRLARRLRRAKRNPSYELNQEFSTISPQLAGQEGMLS